MQVQEKGRLVIGDAGDKLFADGVEKITRMATRKHFIAAAISVPLLGAAPPATSPQPAASLKPPPTPPKKHPSALAQQFALRMRGFDPGLSEKQIDEIAAGIDGNLKIGAQLNPKGRALRNWDEPVSMFEVEG